VVNDSSIEHASGGTPYDVGGVGFVRLLCVAYGGVFLLVGVLGFVPGITTHYGDLRFAGHMSGMDGQMAGAELLGVFAVSVLHNLIHLAYGVVGLAVANRPRAGVAYLIGGGVVYAVVWLYGVLVDESSSANFVPLNSADDWLHLGLAITMVAAGVLAARRLRHRGHGPSLA
jgi:hypothetical protein